MKTKQNVVTLFMWYMYNKWSLEESVLLFGANLGAHIYQKYLNRNDKLYWYRELDDVCRTKVVNRAIEIYKNK